MPRKKKRASSSRKRMQKKKIHKHPAYRWVPGVLNFFVWGSGYLVDKRTMLGLLWLSVFLATQFAIKVSGLSWYLLTTPGNLFLLSHLVISYILFLDGIGGKGSKRY